MKKEILNKIIESQEALISKLIGEIKYLEEGADIDEGDVIDPEDISHKVEANEMEVLLSEQLKIAKKDLNFLTSYVDESFSTIKPGALVYTDKYIFFIGVATIPVRHDDFILLGISVMAPIYSLMRDKKVGDSFSFSTHDYNINKIE